MNRDSIDTNHQITHRASHAADSTHDHHALLYGWIDDPAKMTDSKMDFMRRGSSPLSLTQMQSKVNGITPLQIKLKLLGVLPYRINMQVRADSSDTNDSRHCPIIKGCTLSTMTIVQHWPSHETHAICMARTHALLSPCACGTTLQARQGVAPQAERFFCVLNVF